MLVYLIIAARNNRAASGALVHMLCALAYHYGVMATKTIQDLVREFTDNEQAIKQYNETDTRRLLIDPFFTALGWDVGAEKGLHESQRDVRLEVRQKVAGRTKLADYCFYAHGKKAFYVEAKKPGVNIKEDPAPALQTRRYGWSAKLPIGILTDFEELAIYDCRVRPSQTDGPQIAQYKYYTYREYLDKWDEISGLISKEAVRGGSLSEFENKKRKGDISFDEDFLRAIEGWREVLARHIALRNDDTSEENLNFAVQKIIDRIIFLRICEDRGIEEYKTLARAANKENVYQNLVKIFEQADQKYNSGLFHFQQEKERPEHPDSITRPLKIDDGALRKIIKELYYPQSPYEFSVVSSHVLGSIYERFLGKVIEFKEDAKRAKVDLRPEVRKAGGVYYTPEYIVDYIVQNTVGSLLSDKTPEQVEQIKILDPACGSGSFLISVYQYLLDWHLNYYRTHDPEKWSKGAQARIFGAADEEAQLTLQERKRILLNNVHGVDIDRNAVEVSKLSLLLKVLEYERLEVSQEALWRERVLPDLYQNIKCGNSLVGVDVFMDFGNTEAEMKRVNPFDWRREFKGIMAAGGFDCVVGNPPYIQLQKFKGEAIQGMMAEAGYQAHHSMGDIYALFYEQGIRLLRAGGLLGYITSNKWMRAGYGEPLRRFLAERTNPLQLLDFSGAKLFAEATVDCNILVLKKAANKHACQAHTFSKQIASTHDIAAQFAAQYVRLTKLDAAVWIIADEKNLALKEKIERIGTPLGEWGMSIYRGALTGYNPAFIIDEQKRAQILANCADEEERQRSTELIKPLLRGRDIARYHENWAGLYLIATFPALKININHYPAIKAHLLTFTKKRLDQSGKTGSRKKTNGKWFETQDTIAYYEEFEKEKITYSEIVQKPQFFYDTNRYYTEATGFLITGKNIKYLCGILNSKASNYLFKTFYAGGGLGETGYRYKKKFFVNLPLPPITAQNKTQATELEHAVEQMLAAQQKHSGATTETPKMMYRRQIESLDDKIDKMAYQLYQLDQDEIAIIEAGGVR